MTARDIFGLIVRVVGLAFIVCGLFDLVYVINELVGSPLPATYPTSAGAGATVVFFVLGAAFLMGANLITRVAYGRER